MNEQQLAEILQTRANADDELYSPLKLESFTLEPPSEQNEHPGHADARLVLEADARALTLLAEFNAKGTPKSVRNWAAHSNAGASDSSTTRAIVVPYLSDGVVEQLQRFRVSGLDLNGNYYIRTPDFVAIRLDQKNDYPRSRNIRNVYAGKSSLVGRFLLREDKSYEQVQGIHDRIQYLAGMISLSTVSKALTGLAEDLIVDKQRGHIRLLQPRKLLRRLEREYELPSIESAWHFKLPDDREAQEEILGDMIGGIPHWVWSGASSAEFYTAAPPASVRTAYTRNQPDLNEEFSELLDERFYNCVVQQTRDDLVYFAPDGFWANEVETYLQLSQGDKREREIAENVRENILGRFQE
jgi:hypothetical protein